MVCRGSSASKMSESSVNTTALATIYHPYTMLHFYNIVLSNKLQHFPIKLLLSGKHLLNRTKGESSMYKNYICSRRRLSPSITSFINLFPSNISNYLRSGKWTSFSFELMNNKIAASM